MKMMKALLCAALMGGFCWVAVEVASLLGTTIPSKVGGVGILVVAVGGGYLSRYLSWGWSLGSCGGVIFGFYLPLLLMFFFPDTRYEAALPWLLLSAGIGLAVGGFGLDKIFRRRQRPGAPN